MKTEPRLLSLPRSLLCGRRAHHHLKLFKPEEQTFLRKKSVSPQRDNAPEPLHSPCWQVPLTTQRLLSVLVFHSCIWVVNYRYLNVWGQVLKMKVEIKVIEQRRQIYLFVCLFVWATPSSAQVLLPALCSRTTPEGGECGIICGAGDQTQVSSMLSGKHPACCTISKGLLKIALVRWKLTAVTSFPSVFWLEQKLTSALMEQSQNKKGTLGNYKCVCWRL